uniref:Promethin n=1 Tax=Cacopsylla melanoneura TaxID=428564 RepID=A0A8D9BMG4_9HEMI
MTEHMQRRTERSSTLTEQLAQGEEVVNMARQRIRAMSWNDVRYFNFHSIATYCSNQPIAALVVAGLAMIAILPIMFGITLFMLSVLTFTFMTMGIVMVSAMIFTTLFCLTLVLFGLGYYFKYINNFQKTRGPSSTHSRQD